MAIHGWGRPAGFYSEENIGFVEEVDTIIEAKMEKIHPRGRGPLKLSAMGIEFHPYEFLTLRLIWDVGSAVLEKEYAAFISSPKRSMHTTAPKSFISSQCDTHHQKEASKKTSNSTDGKGWCRKTLCVRSIWDSTVYSSGSFIGCDVFIPPSTKCVIATHLLEETAFCGGAWRLAGWGTFLC